MITWIITFLSATLPQLVLSIIIFIAFWIGGILVQKIIFRITAKKELNIEFINLIGKTAKITMVLFGSVTALGTLGINVSALVAGLGLTGFALGFALKDILANIIAGAMIFLYQPFKLKDKITVSGFEGKVMNIDLRYTTIQTEEKSILIPNSILFKNAISVVTSEE